MKPEKMYRLHIAFNREPGFKDWSVYLFYRKQLRNEWHGNTLPALLAKAGKHIKEMLP